MTLEELTKMTPEEKTKYFRQPGKARRVLSEISEANLFLCGPRELHAFIGRLMTELHAVIRELEKIPKGQVECARCQGTGRLPLNG